MAAMLLHELVADGQPQPEAMVLGRKERLEEAAHLLRPDARTGVPKPHAHLPAVGRQGEIDLKISAAGRHDLESIGDDVAEDLL